MNEFYHYGIKRRSGRYPYGSGDRPYQSSEGSRKERGIIEYLRSKKKEKQNKEKVLRKGSITDVKKINRQEKARLEDLKKERDKKDEDKVEKERVLREGTATEVLKYQGRLTNQELQNAVTRLNLESNLKRLSENDVKSAISTIDDMMKTVQTGTQWIKIGTDAYNAVASIYNSTSDGRKKPMTIIGKGGDGGKKKDK